ncbi:MULTISPECIES: type II toxin-antitoxin system RelE family toxin [Corynebacterium]|uniref:type II toxin-antitoxin system RelE family toxin n=1 Tax=Corynebacterium TaxID=1716 RepID=UPI0020CA6832|nr:MULTISPECIES: type II toxin-antitoxin system RelE/ParE family toxin [Corynebacterium]
MANSTYRITYKASAAKELRKLDRPTQRQLLAAIEDLAVTPRPDGVKKLKASTNLYRTRIGHYRVVGTIAWFTRS